MSYKVSAADLTKIRLNESDTVVSVLQNIAIILATKQGTVPLYRSFGTDHRFVDKPIPVAKTMLYVDVREAIERFEPRAQVVNITFQEDPTAPGVLNVTVEVEIVEQ